MNGYSSHDARPGVDGVRIIAGIAKGRRLVGPRGSATRPPMDRMREAVFSALGARIDAAIVLDLYAGTGSFGLEALSRGAGSVTFVERDGAALAALRTNVDAVGLGGRIVASDVEVALTGQAGPYDIVFVDPPYSLSSIDLEPVLAAVSVRLTGGATVLIHRRRDEVEVQTEGTLALTRRRRYGDSEIWWYIKEAQ